MILWIPALISLYIAAGAFVASPGPWDSGIERFLLGVRRSGAVSAQTDDGEDHTDGWLETRMSSPREWRIKLATTLLWIGAIAAWPLSLREW